MEGLRAKAQEFLSKSDTTGLRRSLENDLTEIDEPRKILKTYDIFISANKQHKNSITSSIGTGATALSVLIAIAQSADAVAKNCPPGADATSSLSCGLSAGQVISAALGVVGASASAKLLWSGMSHVQELKIKLDEELATKLTRVPGKRDLVKSQGRELVSRFAQLNIEDQKKVRDDLLSSAPEPFTPGIL
jgi:hypothetical protein